MRDISELPFLEPVKLVAERSGDFRRKMRALEDLDDSRSQRRRDPDRKGKAAELVRATRGAGRL